MALFTPLRTDDADLGRVQDAIAKAIAGTHGDVKRLLSSLALVHAQYVVGAAQTMTNGAYTVVNYGSAIADTHRSVVAGPDWKFTAPVPGLYLVTAAAGLSIPTSTGYEILLDLRKNGTIVPGRGTRVAATTPGSYGGSVGVGLSTAVECSAGDWLQVVMYQGSGADRALDTSVQSHIEIIRVPGS